MDMHRWPFSSSRGGSVRENSRQRPMRHLRSSSLHLFAVPALRAAVSSARKFLAVICGDPGPRATGIGSAHIRQIRGRALRFLLVSALTVLPLPADAQALHGIIVDSQGERKPFVSVDITGIRKVITRADAKGEFKVEPLPSGNYVVTVRDGRRLKEFTVVIGDGTTSKTFDLEW